MRRSDGWIPQSNCRTMASKCILLEKHTLSCMAPIFSCWTSSPLPAAGSASLISRPICQDVAQAARVNVSRWGQHVADSVVISKIMSWPKTCALFYNRNHCTRILSNTWLLWAPPGHHTLSFHVTYLENPCLRPFCSTQRASGFWKKALIFGSVFYTWSPWFEQGSCLIVLAFARCNTVFIA